MANALQIDTLAFSKKLRDAGADEQLAEAIVEGITASDTSDLATKADIAEVKGELKAEIAEVRTEIAEVKSDLKAEIAEVKSDLKVEIAGLDTKIAEVRTEIARSSNRTIYVLGGLIGFLFVVDRFVPILSAGG